MKLKYKGRILLYFSILFALFTASIIVFERSQERKFKRAVLEEKLDTYTSFIHNEIEKADSLPSEGTIFGLDLPKELRITLIDRSGKVLYDNSISDVGTLPNHLDRPEISGASKQKRGQDIRLSLSNSIKYLYYAKAYEGLFIRVALPFDTKLSNDLKSDNTFLYYIIILFVVSLLFMNLLANRFGKSIKQLHSFATASERDELPQLSFPDDELGEIGLRITHNYKQLKEKQLEIEIEREKLLQHVHSSEEGICFFNNRREVEFYNGLFIQYLNLLTEEPTSNPSQLFADPIFGEVDAFLKSPSGSYLETVISKHGKVFSLHVNLFEYGGSEIILNDITKQEKMRRLKQEMTGNIAHELRTPVTSIRGYLETLLEHEMTADKARHFITQAHRQTLNLSELIQDMGLITKMEEAPQSFVQEQVNIVDILRRIKEEYFSQLQDRGMTMSWDIPETLSIQGNTSLIYSIFRNLTDNAIRYAGEQVDIRVVKYNEDEEYYHFSFCDSGVGISDEKHFNRLFERFYRITEGRTRDSGGTGLGLSIVKNAVLLHKGSITPRNRVGGGLEFLIRLHK